MDRIERLMANRASLPDSRLTVRYEAGIARVELGGGRSQAVRIERDGDGYVFTSVVLGAARADEHRQDLPALANRLWQRNRQTDVVNFTFDRHNRLIGRIEHPANTLDAEELFFYLSRLAIECDRLEYLLTGKNIF
jgi:hypothetical protein